MENHPTSLNVETKNQDLYIEQLSGNIDEKTGFLLEELRSGKLPEFEGRIRVLECGVGGGESLQKIREENKDPFVDLVAFDIIHPYVKRVMNNKKINAIGVVGDAFRFPFKEKSLSVINLSAVLHEIMSYSFGEKGPEDRMKVVKDLFLSLASSLDNNGVFTYRDIYLPEDHLVTRDASYKSHFSKFLSLYSTNILEATSAIYKTNKPEIVNTGDSTQVTAPAHYHRELQRHFITFVDFVCMTTKKLSLAALLKNGEHINVVLDEFFANEALQQFGYTWYKREGKEVYTYASSEEIENILHLVSNEMPFSLSVERKEIQERAAYTGFLSAYSDFVIPDRKQLMLIRKVDR